MRGNVVMMTRRIDEVRMVKPDADSEGEGVMMIIHNICTSKTYRLLFSKEVFCKNKIDIFVSIYSAIYQPKPLTAPEGPKMFSIIRVF